MSGLKLIPASSRSFAGRLLAVTFFILGSALLAGGVVGLAIVARAGRRAKVELARLQLAALSARVEDALRVSLATARSLASEPVLIRTIQRYQVQPPGKTPAEPLSERERALLQDRLAPSHVLEPEGDASRLLRERAAAAGALAASVTEASGVGVAAGRTVPDAVRSEQRWWKNAMSRGADISLPAPDSGVPADAVSLAVAVTEGRTRVGVVQLLVSYEGLLQSVRGPADAVPMGWRLALVDRGGQCVPGLTGAPVPMSADFELAPADRFVSELARPGEGPAAPGHLLYARPLAGGQLVVVASAPLDDLAASLRLGIFLWIGLGALTLAVVAFVLVPPLRRATGDVAALVSYARRTGAGDTGATPPLVRRDDELGALGAALVGSLESLRSSRVELERAKKTLEERVEFRTGELARVNQELKRRAEELAAASKAKDEFLTNISHELRTPLNSIIGLTQLVRDGVADNAAEANAFLDQALVSARHLLNLINDVLDLAKLEAGKLVLELEPLDPDNVVEEVRSIVEPLASQKRLGLEISVAPLLPKALADRMRLRQVLVNVTQNAVKFTPEGKVLVRVRTSDGRRKILFEVEDTGIGIPPDKRALVFEKFIQAEAGTTRRFGGTGLGLPISRLLVEAMHGAIGIETGANGIGTRVWFTVPTPGLEGR